MFVGAERNPWEAGVDGALATTVFFKFGFLIGSGSHLHTVSPVEADSVSVFARLPSQSSHPPSLPPDAIKGCILQ